MDIEVKEKLDEFIDKYAIMIVGTGYIDIIVSRNDYVKFIDSLTLLNIPVIRINWWCCATEDNKMKLWCPHGAWWPWFDWGYYGELYRADDTFELNENIWIKEHNNIVKDAILNKSTYDRDGDILTFKKNNCLTPAIWIDIKWSNKFKKW